jgi:hypothetical protein
MKFSAQREAPLNSCFYPQKLRQHRAIRQEVSDRIFPQFKVWKAKEYCMYSSFFKLKKWGKKTAETRRRNCAVLP